MLAWGRRRGLRRILVEHFTADIRPEFLQFVGQSVVQNQKSKCCGISRSRAVSRNMVDIGNSRGSGIANRFRVVEVIMSRIRPSDKEPVDAMVAALKKGPVSELVLG